MTDHLAKLLQVYYVPLWWFLCLLFALPAVSMGWSWHTDSLGANPLETLTRESGLWSLKLLILTIALTPLRRLLTFLSIRWRLHYGKRLSDWNRVIRLRRMIGLWSFAYAGFHVWLWLEFDAGWLWFDVYAALREKPYLIAGLAAFACLTLLAATSFNGAARLLRRYWKRLHRLVYIAVIAVALHFLWLSKPGHMTAPIIYTAMIVSLLWYRVVSRYGWLLPKAREDGEEVPERK